MPGKRTLIFVFFDVGFSLAGKEVDILCITRGSLGIHLSMRFTFLVHHWEKDALPYIVTYWPAPYLVEI